MENERKSSTRENTRNRGGSKARSARDVKRTTVKFKLPETKTADKIQLYSNVKDLYPENILAGAEGGYNDFLPAWAFPKVQIKAMVSIISKSDGDPDKKDAKTQQILINETIDALNSNMVKAVLSQFEHLTISKIYHYAQLGEFTTILFREKKLVDVLIHVLDKTYYAHKHVLCCHSEFFSTLLFAQNKPPGVITDVTLSNMNPLYFRDFLHFCYYGEIDLNEKNIPQLLNLCNKLNANMLRARIHRFLSNHGELHLDLVKKILTSKLKADRPLAIFEAIEKFDELREDALFLGRLAFEDLMEILSSDDLKIKSELDVFWAAIIWVAYDVRDRFKDLDMLMNTVRVTCMSTLELMDISRASTLIRLSKSCQQIIMNATWVCHAREMGLNDPLSLPIQTPRKLLIGKPFFQPTRAEFDKRYRQYKNFIGDETTEEFAKTLEMLGPGKRGGRVVFADEKGSDLEHVYVAEQRIVEDPKKKKEKKDRKKKKSKKKRKKKGGSREDDSGKDYDEEEIDEDDDEDDDDDDADDEDDGNNNKGDILDLWQGNQSNNFLPDEEILTPEKI